VHQIGLKDYGCLNFSFLTLKAQAVVEAKILRTATTTARDKGKQICRWNHVIYSWKVVKNENRQKKYSFFSTLNQYFPHILYVASKNRSSVTRRHCWGHWQKFVPRPRLVIDLIGISYIQDLQIQNSKNTTALLSFCEQFLRNKIHWPIYSISRMKCIEQNFDSIIKLVWDFELEKGPW
jgi:hypothetical protein